MVEHLSVNSPFSANREIQVRFLWQHSITRTHNNMTEDGCGCFFLVFKNGRPSHWVGDSGVEKDMEEMIEFITDELTGEFKFTQF